jgi:hypothetical protein
MKRPTRALGALAAKCCLVGLMLLSAACQHQVKVEGTLNDTERVTAVATGSPGYGGDLTLTGKDLQCTGRWKYIATAGGLGNLECSDGQTGIFFFSAQGVGGGAIGSRKLLFTFTPIWKG